MGRENRFLSGLSAPRSLWGIRVVVPTLWRTKGRTVVVTCPGCGNLILAPRFGEDREVTCPVCDRAFTPDPGSWAQRKGGGPGETVALSTGPAKQEQPEPQGAEAEDAASTAAKTQGEARVPLRDRAAPFGEGAASFDTALVALALSEVTDKRVLALASGRGDRSEALAAAGTVLLWAVRTTLVLCAVTVYLPWASADGGAAPGPDGPAAARRDVDLLQLSPTCAATFLPCLAACLGVSFAASRRRAFRTILVFQVLATWVVALVPCALYSASGAGRGTTGALIAGGPQRAVSMSWGAWTSLALCGLAWAGAMVYLFMPPPRASALRSAVGSGPRAQARRGPRGRRRETLSGGARR